MSRVTTEDYSDFDYVPWRGYLSLPETKTPRGSFWNGTYTHRLGLVEVYRQEDLTALRAVVDGRLHNRHWRCFWSDKTISMLCRRFLEELHA